MGNRFIFETLRTGHRASRVTLTSIWLVHATAVATFISALCWTAPASAHVPANGRRPAPLILAQEYLLPPPVPPSASCNSVVNQGGDIPETHVVDISGTTGVVVFEYDTYTEPDRMIVSIDGRRIFDTTCVGTRGLLRQPIPLPPGAQKLQIRVEPNCAGGSGTAWTFKLACPTP
jgi:hypothetical protein